MATPTAERQKTTSSSWPEQGQWTFDDWLSLPDDEFRYEVIRGELFMSPPPTIEHQNAVSSLLAAMRLHARKNELGVVLTAPVGVRLHEQGVIVQPDILFVAKERESIIKNDYIEGAPDLVIEVLSPSNWMIDRGRKQETYRRTRVREYWIVDYRERFVDVLVLEGSEYVQRGHYVEGDSAHSEALKAFSMPVSEIFAR